MISKENQVKFDAFNSRICAVEAILAAEEAEEMEDEEVKTLEEPPKKKRDWFWVLFPLAWAVTFGIVSFWLELFTSSKAEAIYTGHELIGTVTPFGNLDPKAWQGHCTFGVLVDNSMYVYESEYLAKDDVYAKCRTLSNIEAEGRRKKDRADLEASMKKDTERYKEWYQEGQTAGEALELKKPKYKPQTHRENQ